MADIKIGDILASNTSDEVSVIPDTPNSPAALFLEPTAASGQNAQSSIIYSNSLGDVLGSVAFNTDPSSEKLTIDADADIEISSTNNIIIGGFVWPTSGNAGDVISRDSSGNLIFVPQSGGSSGVQSVVGDGVTGTAVNVLLEFPNADEVDDSATTNKFVNVAEKITLSNQSGVNTGDETDASIKFKYENNSDTNAFTDAEKSKLAGLDNAKFVGQFVSLAQLTANVPVADSGSFAYVDAGVGQDVELYLWDDNDNQWVLQKGESTAETPASIKTKYESNADTNAFTNSEKTNLANQSGVNTGDETTSSIQSKRPLKTVGGQSIEGSGDIALPNSGVQSVTGDGVDNADSDNPVLTFPNSDEIDDSGTNKFITQIELNQIGTNTSDISSINSSLNDKIESVSVDGTTITGDGVNTPLTATPVSTGVQSVTGDGVGGTATDPVLTFPNSDEIDDSGTNKFITQLELNQIGTNTSDITSINSSLNDKIETVSVDGTTIVGDGVNTPLSAISSGIQTLEPSPNDLDTTIDDSDPINLKIEVDGISTLAPIDVLADRIALPKDRLLIFDPVFQGSDITYTLLPANESLQNKYFYEIYNNSSNNSFKVIVKDSLGSIVVEANAGERMFIYPLTLSSWGFFKLNTDVTTGITISGNGNFNNPLEIDFSGFDSDSITEGSNNLFFTSAERLNLSNQSGVNTGDETDASIKTKYENNLNTNAFTDAERNKLAALESSKFVGQFISLSALQTAFSTAPIGSYAYVDAGIGQDVELYIWDNDDTSWILQQGESTAETPASIKSKYESNSDTNVFTDTEQTNLSNQSGVNTGDETLSSLQTTRPLRTVGGETLDDAGGDVSIGVETITGDGVGGTATDPVLTFPNSDEIDDSGTNKFITQIGLNQIATNASDITSINSSLNDKIETVSVDGTTIVGDGVNTPLSATPVSTGVQSVTGDGVDNTDSANPEISFPTKAELDTIRPLRTVDGEDLTDGNSDISIGVAGISGDGVGGTLSEPVISFPNADEVNDDNTANKFVTQTEIDQIGTNTSDIAGKEDQFSKNTAFNKNFGTSVGEVPEASSVIFKPIASNFEFDLLSQTTTDGQFVYRTPNNGVVKIVDIMSNVNLPNNGIVPIQLQGAGNESFSVSSDFPKNQSNTVLGQDPQNNKSSFLPFIYNDVDGQWLENTVDKQVNLWRITINYTRNSTQANREIVIRLTNPSSGFNISESKILPNGNQFSTNSLTYEFTTIADSSSIGSGYLIELETFGASSTLNNVEIVRTSLEKL